MFSCTEREADLNMDQEVEIKGVSYSCQNLKEKQTFSHRSLTYLWYMGVLFGLLDVVLRFFWRGTHLSSSSLLLTLFFTMNVI